MILVIDNYDSFTYNLVQLVSIVKDNIEVRRNDKITIDEIEKRNFSHILISPGPKYPIDAGISMEIIKKFSGKIPILGICLGHQSIIESFGGEIVKMNTPYHGKTSEILYKNKSVFKNIKGVLIGARYHSLVANNNKMPDCLDIIAKTSDKKIMAVAHKTDNTIGLQFHPESFLSNNGENIIKEFLNIRGGKK